jgi:exodeoxyribonuclease-5
LTGLERLSADAAIEVQRRDLREMRKPKWRLNDASDVLDCRLLVLDEVSMVGDEMAADVLSFEKPVLVLGDPGQLPPIKGSGAFTEGVEPDVMLTEIHRQAQESAIIRLATMAREFGFIPYGQHDAFVSKMSRHDIVPAQLLRADQVICGRNATRLMLNNAMRRASGFGNRLPEGPAEKVICLKNDHDLGLINGMFIQLDRVGDLSRDVVFSATVINEDGDVIGGRYAKSNQPKDQPIYAGHFLDHEQLDDERDERDWKKKKGLIEATFGYAITGHKSQGSQWENVIVWDDHLGRTKEDRARWLYTAITRAETGLVILD